MEKLSDKIKIWHLIILILIQIIGFIYAVGAKDERMKEIEKIARKNHEITIRNKEGLQRMEILNERIKSLSDKMGRNERKKKIHRNVGCARDFPYDYAFSSGDESGRTRNRNRSNCFWFRVSERGGAP